MDYFEIFENGEIAYTEKKYDLALKFFLRAYDLNPSNTNANYIACCYIALKQYEEAEKILKELTNTTFWETPWYNLGRLYLKQNKFDEALKCLQESILINPDNDDCYFYFGVYYEKTEKYLQAINCYKKAIELSRCDEDKSSYLNNIGMCYYRLKSRKNANDYFCKALRCNAFNEDAKHNIAMTANND